MRILNSYMTRLIGLLLIPFLCITGSCRKSESLTQFHSFPNNTWNRFEKQNFNFRIEDVSFPYDLKLILRHNDSYPFDNLYVHVVIEKPGGEERIMEYDFKVKDTDGQFLSRSTNGYDEITFTLHTGLYFQEEGNCRVEIENLIPKIEIPGILELGLCLQRSREE